MLTVKLIFLALVITPEGGELPRITNNIFIFCSEIIMPKFGPIKKSCNFPLAVKDIYVLLHKVNFLISNSAS
jgi:hypothetical protein